MKHKQIPKQLSIVLAVLMFSLCINKTNAQGPNAPEAASFEPVDATDMVNLVTGDLSYVLPLLNVPSPEGGYPIALSYHAGIAMEQEASWVGLGWSLNPGAINRAVNGYPDDWGKTNVDEFFYDEGWTNNYYSFNAGVSFKGGVSVGLGLSWGSNQSLGGFVSASIGPKLGKGGTSVGGSIGTGGVSVNAGIGHLNASVGTSGVGIGYGFSKSGSDTSIGVGLNYSFNSGLSGSVSISKSKRDNNNELMHGKSSSLGINFSSQGISVNGKINGIGAGISTASYGISVSDYDVTVSSSGFFIPAYIFYIGYNHTKVKYSLYKYNNLYTSGMVYPVVANELEPYSNSTNLSRWLKANHFMDVNSIQRFGANSLYYDLINEAKKNDRNNLILPSYDNYTVNAQGLSGSISPYIHSELNLSDRGRGEQNDDNEYVNFLNHSLGEYMNPTLSVLSGNGLPNEDAVKKMHFTFSNVYNSFLRLEMSNIEQQSGLPSVSSDHIMNYFKTNQSSNFNNINSLTNGLEPRKREGNFIRTYTNKEIRDSYAGGNISTITNFIDAKELDNQNNEINLDRSDINVFLDEGIGAYQITTADGRVYHYSLPVYNFESFFKNFDNPNDEDDNFLEIQKTTPYATHWLLTAITGPDYVDNNNNGTLDESDYGYWVAFDYGKWSDGYIWQTPNGRFEENIDKDDTTKKTYSYAWGRKQIYYLDAIKTRTHTALFIKDIREDNLSSTQPNKWKKKLVNPNDFNPEEYCIQFDSNKIVPIDDEGDYYLADGTGTDLPETYYDDYCGTTIANYFTGKKSSSIFIDMPVNKTLKLSKIILLKNEDFSVDKKHGNITSQVSGYSYSNFLFRNVFIHGETHNYEICGQNLGYNLFTDSGVLKSFNSHQHSNVLDVSDIQGLGLEAKAQQIIELNHDYSLAQNSPNSDAPESGRLSLRELAFKGKQGIQTVPPYKFSYYGTSSTNYHKDNIDAWGYRENNVDQIWSLNRINIPTGGIIKINYEEDSYYAEAAYSEEPEIKESVKLIFDTPNNPSGLCNLNEVEITLRKSDDNYFVSYPHIKYYAPSIYFKVGEIYRMTFNPSTTNPVNRVFELISINDHKIIIRFLNSDDPQLCLSYLQNYKEAITLHGRVNDYRIIEDPIQGRKGGGIRTKSITVSNGLNDIAISEYIYTNPSDNTITGITSYAPTKEQKGVPYLSELPPPMVTYGRVTMINKDGNDFILGSTAYEFETLEPRKEEAGYIFSLGECFRVKENQNQTFENGSVIANKYTIESRLGNIGRIKSVITYNNKGQILHEKRNYYKEGLDADGEIGVSQESHKSYKRVNKNGVEKFYVSSTSRIDYPSVLENASTIQGGFTNTTYFDKHDFLTGQVLESRAINSNGNEIKTELVPAYTKYGTGNYSMASKIDNPTNYNMLTQEAMTKTYIKLNGQWKETSVGITTWNNDWTYRSYDGVTHHETDVGKKIWRKHKTFVWDGGLNPNGTLNGFTGDDDSFVWNLGQEQTNSDWKNVSTTTLYNHYSSPLEVKDINNNYAATKMTGGKQANQRILATSNARYTEMFYSGAEETTNNPFMFSGEVGKGDVLNGNGPSGDKAHTGYVSLKIAPNNLGFIVNMDNSEFRLGKYKLSVWVHKDDETRARVSVNSVASTFNGERVRAGEWVMLNHYTDLNQSIDYQIGIKSSSGTIYVDDFRLYPVSSSMTSYVYNEWDELWCIIGDNGLASKFEYDAAGRLVKTYTEVEDFNGGGSGGFKKVSENDYNYKH